MIDLNYYPKKKAESWEPEEIVCAILAIVIWTVITFGIMGAC